ncbi:hypothetical protein K474DRAFT_1126640 [Panus rudis PR-1116 ss-1]|nr:hypothetical protein K474DRAFT_1126640 [Panus rudis PR-1116 ss-1]
MSYPGSGFGLGKLDKPNEGRVRADTGRCSSCTSVPPRNRRNCGSSTTEYCYLLCSEGAGTWIGCGWGESGELACHCQGPYEGVRHQNDPRGVPPTRMERDQPGVRPRMEGVLLLLVHVPNHSRPLARSRKHHAALALLYRAYGSKRQVPIVVAHPPSVAYTD